MGILYSILEKFNTRGPDGSLLKLESGKAVKSSLLASLSMTNNNATSNYAASARGEVKSPGDESVVGPGSSKPRDRPSRRHPTYAAKAKTIDTEESNFEDVYEEESEDEYEQVSAKDLQSQKILEFRKLLTKVVKLRTAIFQETVKVTCSKDGHYIEWYKGKKQDGGGKKASGQFPISKIVSLKSKSDNPKTLDVATNLPPMTNFYFTFKSREDREIWQSQLESFKKQLDNPKVLRLQKMSLQANPNQTNDHDNKISTQNLSQPNVNRQQRHRKWRNKPFRLSSTNSITPYQDKNQISDKDKCQTSDKDKYQTNSENPKQLSYNQNTLEKTGIGIPDILRKNDGTGNKKLRQATINLIGDDEYKHVSDNMIGLDSETQLPSQASVTHLHKEIKRRRNKWNYSKKPFHNKINHNESLSIEQVRNSITKQNKITNREKPCENIENRQPHSSQEPKFPLGQTFNTPLNLATVENTSSMESKSIFIKKNGNDYRDSINKPVISTTNKNNPRNLQSIKQNDSNPPLLTASNNMVEPTGYAENSQCKAVMPNLTSTPSNDGSEDPPKLKVTESKGWKMEIYKISTLYHDSFKFIRQDDNQIIFQIIHYPTDPDFDNSFTPNGFLWEINVLSKYFDETLQGSEMSEHTTISTKNKGLSILYGVTISQVFSHNIKNSYFKTNHIYEALKLLDKQLSQIQIQIKQFESEQINKTEQKAEWTIEEQSRLEEALVWYRRVRDPQKKWTLISQYLNTRTEKECIERFKYCREIASQEMSKTQQASVRTLASPNKSESPQELLDEVKYNPPNSPYTTSHDSPTSNTGEHSSEKEIEELSKGPFILIEGLDLLNISTICIITIKIQYFCKECMKLSEMSISTEGKKLGLDIYGHGKNCEKCNNRIVARYQPRFAFIGSEHAGRLHSEDCEIIDIIGANVIVLCSECSHEYTLTGVQNGFTKSFNCHDCYAKLNLSIENLLLNLDLKNNTISELTKEVQKLKITQNRTTKKPKDMSVRLQLKRGQALPDNGSCKHYKKSFRWLRFPCCGMAYPCDVCHDLVSDHPHDWATRMICGFCSLEQNYSQKPCTCGESLTADRSGHWEGGRGNRNKITMNRKDKHKYKNLTKIQSTGNKK